MKILSAILLVSVSAQAHQAVDLTDRFHTTPTVLLPVPDTSGRGRDEVKD